MKRSIFLLLLLTSFFVFSCGGGDGGGGGDLQPGSGGTSEKEPNGTRYEAQFISSTPATINGSIPGASYDVDMYKFMPTSSKQFTIHLSVNSADIDFQLWDDNGLIQTASGSYTIVWNLNSYTNYYVWIKSNSWNDLTYTLSIQ